MRTRAAGSTALALLVLLWLAAAPAALAEGPTASFTWSPEHPTPGQTVTFKSTSSSGGGHSIASQAWDFNGGRDNFADASGGQVTHAFASAGSYAVWLRVTDDHGDTSVAKHTVSVGSTAAAPGPNQPPVASFSVSPGTPVAGQPVTLASTSTDADGTIAAVAWDMNGDGQFTDAATPTVTYTFPNPGTYTVGLRVTDNRGAGSTAFRTLTVPAAAPSLLQALVRIRGAALRRGAKIKLFTVLAPAGARVNIRCRHASCAHRRITITRTAAAGKTTTLFRFRSLQKRLSAGTTVEVRVTAPGAVGKYTRLVIRSLKQPKRTDRCLAPGSTKPTSCPSA
ncbi:MAG: PKD domain-containing protein [Thermoleophilaceae bacterium]